MSNSNAYDAYLEKYFKTLEEKSQTPSNTQARMTIKLFQLCIYNYNCNSINELCDEIKRIAKHILMLSFPLYVVCENISRRIYKVCSDERCLIIARETSNDNDEEFDSLKYILMNERKNTLNEFDLCDSDFDSNQVDKNKLANCSPIAQKNNMKKQNELEDFKNVLLEAIDELEIEVEATINGIANQALDHIHSDEVILTSGYSSTLLSFLKKAGKRRTFTVIVAESNPVDKGHILAKKLSELHNLKITIIPDSAIFAIMSRVNKVIISTYSVCPNGTVLCPSGTYQLALAARQYAVPLFVCAGLYKLSYQPRIITKVKNVSVDRNYPTGPYRSIKNDALDMFNEHLKIYNPQFDEIPPLLINLIITNIGSHQMSYIHRLTHDLYKTSAPRYHVD